MTDDPKMNAAVDAFLDIWFHGVGWRSLQSREVDGRRADASRGLKAALDVLGRPEAPINMLLFCPSCGAQHVDAPDGDWTNPPHRSHLCAACGIIWSAEMARVIRELLLDRENNRDEHIAIREAWKDLRKSASPDPAREG